MENLIEIIHGSGILEIEIANEHFLEILSSSTHTQTQTKAS